MGSKRGLAVRGTGLVVTLIVAATAACVWRERWAVNQDGVSYLDIAQAWADGRWGDATNSYWGPLYSWLLAILLAVVGPARSVESVWVKGLNFAILVLVLVAFRRCLAALARTTTTAATVGPPAPGDARGAAGGPLAYGLLGWAVLMLTDTSGVGADLLVTGIFLECTTRMLALREAPSAGRTHAAFGALLGLGYLAKAVMLPLSVLFLASAYLGTPHRNGRRALLAVAALLLVAGPYVVLISRKAGRPTTGDVGRLAYAWLVNGVREVHWQGEEEGSGRPAHPTRRVLPDPPVFEFDGPVGGSYPVWYDKAWWNEGVATTFDLDRQAAAVRRNLSALVWIVFRRPAIAVLAAAAFLFVLLRRRGAIGRLRACRPVLVVALGTIALYLLVHVESRYLAAPLTLLGLCAIRVLGAPPAAPPTAAGARAIPAWVGAGVACLLVLGSAIVRWRATDPEPVHQRVAAALGERGVPPGAKVGYVGRTVGPYWARVASVRIVSEMRHDVIDEFWTRPRSEREAVLARLASFGSGVVVAWAPPAKVREEGWEFLGGTDYAMRRFAP